MTNITRRTALAGLSAAATLPIIGAPAFGQTKTKLTVGALRFTSHAASFVAKERGYFDEAGLDVDFAFFQAAQPMAVAIASGDADFAVTAISGGLVSLAQKDAVRVIAGALREEKGIDGQKIIASDAAFQAGVKTPNDLDGKAWAVTQAGSSFHYMGSKIAAAEGISLEFKPLQKVGAIIGAMKSGQVDGWSIVPHIAKPLSGAGAVHIIGDVADYLPDYQVTTVFTSKATAEGEEEKAKAFLSAFQKGADDFNAALVDKTAGDDAAEEMVKLVHKYVYTDRPYEKAKPSIVTGAMRITTDMNKASVDDQLAWYDSEGLVKGDMSMVVDGRYL